MSNHDWNSMNELELDLDLDFDSILQNSVPELPPDHVVQNVTPWRKAMNRILLGMALSAITLNFWGLNYILPTISIILTILGFRAVRNENGWFKGCLLYTSDAADEEFAV